MLLVMSTFQNCQKGVVLKRKKMRLFSAQSSNLTAESGSILCVVKMIVLQGRDIGNCSDDSRAMADKAKNRRRGNYCVASGPNMANCESNSLTPGVTMHHFPKNKTSRKHRVVSKNFMAFVLIVLILLCFHFVHWFPFIHYLAVAVEFNCYEISHVKFLYGTEKIFLLG